MTTREERFLALRTATTEWADREEEALTDEAARLRSIAERVGSGRLSSDVTGQASALVQDEIDEFLTS